MFTKKPDVNAGQPAAGLAPAPRPAPSPGPMMPAAPQRAMAPSSMGSPMTGKSPASSIGPDLTIMGNLISKGEVVVDGEVQGDITCAHLTVGQTARITGGIVAEDVVVRGHVMGSIRGNRPPSANQPRPHHTNSPKFGQVRRHCAGTRGQP